MALKPKAIIATLDEERLYPITKASNVILQNGENAQTVVASDRVEDMFSPILRKTNASIFNCGLGDNNDYSLNVVNSAYNSCVLNGQSFANLQHKAIYTVSDSSVCQNLIEKENEISFTISSTPSSNLYVNMGILNLQVIKPNTRYYVKFDVLQGVNQISFCDTTGLTIFNSITVAVDNGFIVTTKSSVPLSELILYGNVNSSSTEVRIKNAMIIEYSDGMENYDIPYFNGVGKVKAPYIKNYTETKSNLAGIVLKNYFDGEWERGSYLNYGIPDDEANSLMHFKRNKNKMIKVPVGSIIITPQEVVIHEFDINGNFIKYPYNIKQLKLTEDTYFINFRTVKDLSYYDDNFYIYELDMSVSLRSLPNGVHDSLNLDDKEYIQRVGEIILDGTHVITTDKPFYPRFYIELPDMKKRKDYSSSMLCSEYTVISGNDLLSYTNSSENYGVTGYSFSLPNSNRLCFNFKNGDNTIETVDAMKAYLQSNPITVFYELKEPVIKKINCICPFSYEDGYVELKGGIEESLIPSIEYSVVVNRNGQIHTNMKIIEEHQKQLDEIESIILGNILK